jgi:hypothetical protein
MKGESSTMLLGIVTALILVVNGLQAGLLLEPTTIDPSQPAAAMISAQHYESLTGLIMLPLTARRSITMDAVNPGLIQDADSHDRNSCSPRYNDRWVSNSN